MQILSSQKAAAAIELVFVLPKTCRVFELGLSQLQLSPDADVSMDEYTKALKAVRERVMLASH